MVELTLGRTFGASRPESDAGAGEVEINWTVLLPTPTVGGRVTVPAAMREASENKVTRSSIMAERKEATWCKKISSSTEYLCAAENVLSLEK